MRHREALALLAFGFLVFGPLPASAVDEIQVYNGEIAKPGQFTLQQHLNYGISGRREADFPGGLVPNRALNGTPELAYGVTDWYELGLYFPFAVSGDKQFLSDGFKIRHLFVAPNAAQRNFFYGVNFEFSYATPRFSQTKFGMEIRPIVGWRSGDYEFIVNPIVDLGFGAFGDATFTPALRVARNFGEDFALGFEYYADVGPIGRPLPLAEQGHNLFGVVDFKVGRFDVNFGLGYGFTGGSDRFMVKTILGTAFEPINMPAKKR